jgi:hypothetical protein
VQGVHHTLRTFEELTALLRSRGTSVFIFSIEYIAAGRRVAHTLHAAVEGGALRFIDTTGQVFRTVQELVHAYPNASIHAYGALEIPFSVIIRMEQAASAVGGPAAVITEAQSIDIGVHVIPPWLSRGIHGYGYDAHGHRTGTWPDGLTSPPTMIGRRGMGAYGCDSNNQPVGNWPVGVTPRCD